MGEQQAPRGRQVFLTPYELDATARAAYDAVRAFVRGLRPVERSTSADWDSLPPESRVEVRRDVQSVLSGMDPAQLHDMKVEVRRRDGWVHGREFDAAKMTDPCLLPYGLLPVREQAKRIVFHDVAREVARTFVAARPPS